MASFHPLIWLALVGVSGAAILGFLFSLACRVRDEVALHQLRVDSMRLREEYLARIRAMEQGLPDPGAGAARPETTPRAAESPPVAGSIAPEQTPQRQAA